MSFSEIMGVVGIVIIILLVLGTILGIIDWRS